jgi:hypothetical protein
MSEHEWNSHTVAATKRALDARKAEWQGRIFALPQAQHIKTADAERWIDGMVAREPALVAYERGETTGPVPDSEIDWHIDRARGIGGSEAGTGLLHANKRFYHDVSLPRMFDQKLFRILPDEANHHMRRGTVLEPLAQRMFHTLHNAFTDDAARERVRKAPVWSRYPWLIGNDDDLVIISNKRYLVDYKFPEEMVDDVPLPYKAQLHHYWARATAAGVPIDGLIIANASIPGAQALVDAIESDPGVMEHVLAMGEALVKAPNPERYMLPLRVDFSQKFVKRMINLNDQVWRNYVLEGKRPAYFRRDTVFLTDDELAHGTQLADRLARYKALQDYAGDQLKDTRKAIDTLLSGKDLEGKKQPFPVLTVSRRGNLDSRRAMDALIAQGVEPASLTGESRYDTEALAAAADAVGVDVSKYTSPGAPDKKKIDRALADAQLDPKLFTTYSFSAGLTRSSKGPGAEIARSIKYSAHSLVDRFLDQDLTVLSQLDEDVAQEPAPQDAASAQKTGPDGQHDEQAEPREPSRSMEPSL